MALHSRDAVTASVAVATRSRTYCSIMEGHTSLIRAVVLLKDTQWSGRAMYDRITWNTLSFVSGDNNREPGNISK